MPSPNLKLILPQDFFADSKESKAVSEVKKKIRQRRSTGIDQAQLRAQEDWSYLSQRVVGAEQL